RIKRRDRRVIWGRHIIAIMPAAFGAGPRKTARRGELIPGLAHDGITNTVPGQISSQLKLPIPRATWAEATAIRLSSNFSRASRDTPKCAAMPLRVSPGWIVYFWGDVGGNGAAGGF